MFWGSLYDLLQLAIVLLVLRYTASDYHFGIFKLFLFQTMESLDMPANTNTEVSFMRIFIVAAEESYEVEVIFENI